MEIFWERPGQGGQSEPIARFLEEQGLRPDHGVQATVSLREDGRILACGGLEGNVIKTVALKPATAAALNFRPKITATAPTRATASI